jgi:GT2 family glycosyltransferase
MMTGIDREPQRREQEENPTGGICVSALPNVSILVVNYNGGAHLREFFESALSLDYPRERYEIVVVDNGSTDGSEDYVEALAEKHDSPRFRLIKLDRNHGFAEGSNIGVRHCRAELIAMINNDTVLEKNWLAELVKAAESRSDAIYGSKMLWYKRRNVVIYGGGVLLSWGLPHHTRMYQADSSRDESVSEVFYADGCGLLLSKRLFARLGGFDRTYFNYAEDYELSWKAWLLGYEVYFVPTAKFWHKVSATGIELSSFQTYNLWKNHFRNIMKFAEVPTLAYMLPLLLAQCVMYYISLRKPHALVDLSRALIYVLTHMNDVKIQRAYYQGSRRVSDGELKQMGLILPFRTSLKAVVATLRRRKIARGY